MFPESLMMFDLSSPAAVAGVILSLQIRRHLMKRSKRGRKGGADATGVCEGGGEIVSEKIRPRDGEETETTALGKGEHKATVECLSLTVQCEGALVPGGSAFVFCVLRFLGS